MSGIALSLVTYRRAELDGAEPTGWTEGSGLKMYFNSKDGVHGTRQVSMPSTTQQEEWEECEEFEVDVVAGWKYIAG
jgi:hypothetical protein